MLCNSYDSKILHEEFHWIYLPGEIKLLLVTVNNRLILEIEIVHDLSYHPIGWEWVEIVPLILCSHGLHETVASLYCVIFSSSPACSFCSERCLCDCEQLKLLVASVFHVWLTFVTRNKWSKLLIQRWRDLEELTSWSTMPVQSSSPTLLIPAWRDMISWCRSTLVGHICGKYHVSLASQLVKIFMLLDYMPVMKIRWFASQNATHFRVFANQFNNLAHSGANHLVHGNVSIRFISIQSCQQSDCSWFHVSSQHSPDAQHFDSDSGWGGGCG